MSTYTIDFTRSETYEAGAILIALLAHPEDDQNDTARSSLHASLCGYWLNCRAAADPAWARAPHAMKPIYAFRDVEQGARDLRTLGRRFRDRLAAAKMAIPFLIHAATGRIRLPASACWLSLNQLAEVVADDSRLSQVDTIETRIWRPSLPVIHLATALACLMDRIEKRPERRLNLFDLLANRELLEAIIEWAEVYERIVTNRRQFNIDPARIVRVRLAG